MKAFREANMNIQGMNRKLNNTYEHNGIRYDKHVMSESIFEFIMQLREELASLLKLRQAGRGGSNDPDWIAHNKQIVTIALAAKKPLAEMSLRWQSITPDNVRSPIENAFRQALPLMDKNVQM